jgi:hypothetical protein
MPARERQQGNTTAAAVAQLAIAQAKESIKQQDQKIRRFQSGADARGWPEEGGLSSVVCLSLPIF